MITFHRPASGTGSERTGSALSFLAELGADQGYGAGSTHSKKIRNCVKVSMSNRRFGITQEGCDVSIYTENSDCWRKWH